MTDPVQTASAIVREKEHPMTRKTYPCRSKGCIAVVSAEGDLCAAHYDQCGICGHPRRRHPVVYFGDGTEAPVMTCYEFQHQGMELPKREPVTPEQQP